MPYPREPSIPGLTHTSTPYTPHPTRLQTLDIWLPTTLAPHGHWLIYLHGGAWRDPTQDSLCAVPTLRALVTRHASLFTQGRIAGIASLNYRLSPYAMHPTDPSAPGDADRNVVHPAHVEDVRDALAYLVREYSVERWIGVGHSCGATLLLQLSLVCKEEKGVRLGARGLVLLAGIYDVPVFLEEHAPPKCPANIAAIYKDIVVGAFGEDERVWEEMSPVGVGKRELWGRRVVLGYSAEDELVEAKQREVMLGRYVDEGWVRDGDGKTEKVVEVRDLKMGHDEVWEDGVQIADLIAEMVAKMDL